MVHISYFASSGPPAVPPGPPGPPGPPATFDSGMFQSKFIHCCITSIYAYAKTLDSCHIDFFIRIKMKISCRHGSWGGLIGYWYGMV